MLTVFENSGLKLFGQMRDTENVDSIRECKEDRSGNIGVVILASATRMRCSLLGTMSLKYYREITLYSFTISQELCLVICTLRSTGPSSVKTAMQSQVVLSTLHSLHHSSQQCLRQLLCRSHQSNAWERLPVPTPQACGTITFSRVAILVTSYILFLELHRGIPR